MAGETRVFISHTFEDNDACVPLTAALDAWEIPYHFDAAPPGGAPMLSPEVQQALTASTVFIRVCTRHTSTSIPMSLESGAFRGLQAQRGGAQRTLINLILDSGYQREPFDNATLFIDATTKSRFDWLSELARALGITTVGRRLSRRSAVALGVAGAVALASTTSAGVVLARNRPASTSNTPRTGLISTLSGQTKWTLPLANYGIPAIAASGNALYVFSDGGLMALSPADGKRLWTQAQVTPDLLSGPTVPAIANGAVYVLGSGSSLYAVSTQDGHVLWNQPAGHSNVASPAASRDGIFVVQSDGLLYAYHPADGSPLWKANISNGALSDTSTSAPLRPPPTAAGGVVYVGSNDHNLYAVNASDGSVKWAFLTRGRVFSTPAVVNGRVYFGSEDGYIYAVNVSDHTQAWSYMTDFDVVGSPAVVNGIVYIGSRDEYLYALDAQHGFAYWRAFAGKYDPTLLNNGGDQVNCLPTVGADAVYVTAGALVYSFSIVDGTQLWRYKTNEQATITSPVLIGALVFAGADDKNLYAINI